MTGARCPECGGERSERPGAGCACGAGTAVRPGRDARRAEIAAAEDFDPLRIRPYVTLHSQDPDTDDTDDTGHTGHAGHTGDADHAGAPADPGEAPGAAGPAPQPANGAPGTAAPGVTSVSAGMPPAAPGARPDGGAADGAGGRSAAAYAGDGPDPVQPRRRRPFAVVAVGAAVAAVVGTAAFAGGLFDAKDDRDTALPEATSSVPDTDGVPAASAPEPSSASPSTAPSPSASASVPAEAPSASPSSSRSPSASPSPTVPQPPSPSASATEAPTAPVAAPPVEEVAGTTLRRGDRGPEVSELQRRLQEVWVYRGPDDGTYSAQVEQAVAEYQRWASVRSDPPGVYGPETRSALEARTTGRGRRS